MGKYRIEIIGEKGKSVINVEGCKSIEKYTSELISVTVQDVNFTVCGKELSMPVLIDNNLCIRGYVKETSFGPSAKEKQT